jgi:hypothetical protein
MSFPYNATGIDANAPKFQPIPPARYTFVIMDAVEKVSSKGNNMVEIDVKVIEHAEHHGHEMKHWVTFIPAGQKGDWMNVHFRKCIGVPYEGDVAVDALTWKGRKFDAKVEIETKPYTNKEGVVKAEPRNKISNVYPYQDHFPEVSKVSETEEVPF